MFYKHTFIAIAMVLHIGCIILFNTLSMQQSIKLLQTSANQSDTTDQTGRFDSLLLRPVFRWYTHLSGTECLYGFFAPKVGSQYVVQFKLYDRYKRLLTIRQGPHIQQAESIIRYSRLLDQCEAFLPHDQQGNERQQRYVSALLHNLAISIANDSSSARFVLCEVYVSHISGIKSRTARLADYKLIHQQMISR